MGLFDRLKRDGIFITRLLRTLRSVKSVEAKAGYGFLVPDVMEQAVDAHRDRIAFIFENRTMTFGEFDALANRVAHWGLAQGFKPGQAVALFMPNRPEYVAVWYGLAKIGVITALINNQLVGKSLAHCVAVGEAVATIVDGDLADTYMQSHTDAPDPTPVWRWDFGDHNANTTGTDLASALAAAPDSRPDPAIRAHINAKEPVLRIYTSGTTGMPKAANVTHMRARNYMTAFGAAVKTKPDDRMLMVLPLYHSTGGLCGVGCAFLYGAATILDRKFSASRFWDLAADHGATMVTYVGELCRFLANAPDHPRQTDHTIRVAFGNGLRPDVWPKFVSRFSIPWVLEFYGATEGNVSLLNLDNTPGAVGRIPPIIAHRFNACVIKYNFETGEPVRGDDGLCVRADPDEVGEMLGEIRADEARYRFEGYAGQREQTKKKILTDVFKPGDQWFRTGDLMRIDQDGYIFFVDRAGDTFRWKSENVSTTEVAEALSTYDGVMQANVYGVPVPGYDGKAGMAAVVLQTGCDLAALGAHLRDSLPVYARPVFLRVLAGDGENDTTGTFKFQKKRLVEQGFDISEITDTVLIADEHAGFKPLDEATYQAIGAGQARL